VTDEVNKLKDTIHQHDLRINSIEIKHEGITFNVTDLQADRKRILWIVITIILSGLVYAGLSGLQDILYVQ